MTLTKTLLLLALVALYLMMLTAPAHAQVTQASRTQIVITPVACPNKAMCNVFHVRWIKPNGVVEFNRDIPSAWMASSLSVEVVTVKGTMRVWSDR